MYHIIKIKRTAIFSIVICTFVVFFSIYITAITTDSQKVEVPILMYHSILDDSKYFGDYVISPNELEKDMKYLKDNGYTAIGYTELINYTNGIEELPEKPIILSFDDGYYNNFVYAFELAKKYEMKIVISPIGYHSEIAENDDHQSKYYSHITSEQISQMSDSGLVEFGNHSYNLHSTETRKGIKRLGGESLENYTKHISEDILTAQSFLMNATGIDTKLFVYPFGAISKESPQIISDLGFTVSFSCEEKMNFVTRDTNSLVNMGRFLRPFNLSASQILNLN